MTSRSEDQVFPESIPNPSLNHFAAEHGSSPILDNAGISPPPTTGGSGNSYNKLKLRVPVERRYVPSLFLILSYHHRFSAIIAIIFSPISTLQHRLLSPVCVHRKGTTPEPLKSAGLQRSTNTTSPLLNFSNT